ncbi:MAG: F0F1 ATP synthase subunit A [bacterium]|nr:F0F1 ATP synthase subunit A [bacterium]
MDHHPFTFLSHLPLPEHTSTAILVCLILIVFALRVRPKLTDTSKAIEPEDGITARNVAEAFVEGMSSIAEGVIGHHYKQYVPLLATFFAFILVSNLLGLIPGVSPPTSNSNVTFALGVTSFIAYNVYGLKASGAKYLKHFLGPVLFLAPLLLVIELMSHAFRPLSLGIRLFANMFADHELIRIFTELTFFGFPVIFYVLGTLVCVVQAVVFTMLTAVYISGAVHEEH